MCQDKDHAFHYQHPPIPPLYRLRQSTCLNPARYALQWDSSPCRAASTSPTMDLFPTSSETYEETHVHSVYEAIAPHFSSTRYKVLPHPSSRLLHFQSQVTKVPRPPALAPRRHLPLLSPRLLSRRRSRLRQRQEPSPRPVALLHRLRPLCGTGFYRYGSVPRRCSRFQRCFSVLGCRRGPC